jgi:hypothetical protein
VDFDGNTVHDQTLTVSAAGTYQFTAPNLADGPYTATATFSAGLSGNDQNTTDYTIDTVAPDPSAMSPTGTVNTGVARMTVIFTKPLNLHSFPASAVTLTGPAGAIPVNAPQLVSGSTYSITFAPQTAEGAYSLTVASTVTDHAGNPMGHTFTHSFTITLPDLAVTSASAPSAAAEGTTIPVAWKVANVSASNPTGSAWKDAVYISSNSALDGSAVRLASVAAPAGAAGGGGRLLRRRVGRAARQPGHGQLLPAVRDQRRRRPGGERRRQ